VNRISATAVIITKNEECTLSACLKSLSEFDEIIVVDNGSSDATLTIAKEFTNVRIMTTQWLGYGPTRQLGADAAKNEWIFWIDADERLSKELSSEILTQLADASRNNVLAMKRHNYFLGRRIRGCGWSPDWVVRLFHRQHAQFNTKTVHEGLTGYHTTDVIQLRTPLIHFSYRNIRQFFEKNLRYAGLAAVERSRTGRSVEFWQIPLRTAWEFFRNYVFRRGIFDGIPGFFICVGSAIYVFTRDTICYLEANSAPPSDSVESAQSNT
jgi:glycosyltransferase involved in cell wall biosynthesis